MLTSWLAGSIQPLRKDVTMPDTILFNWLTSERVRYLGAFSSIWSGFNDWYRRDPRFVGNDRDCINTIQQLSNTDPLVVAFDGVCDQPDTHFQRSMPLSQDAMTRGAAAYLTQSRFSLLVREVMLNPDLARLVWIAGQTRPPNRSTRQLPIAYVPETVYFSWYRQLRATEAEPNCMMDSSISVQDAMACWGIVADGCAFFAGPVSPTASQTIVASFETHISMDQLYQTLRRFASPPQHDWVPTSRFAIALELLYLIRNNVMHGTLDPTDIANDAVGRAAQDLLHTWLLGFAS